MKALVFDRVGAPGEVLRIADLPMPEPASGEVLVKMQAASVNPGDFLFTQSLYPEPRRPRFPLQIAGNQGAGVVVRGGPRANIAPGTLVSFFHERAWAEYAAVPEQWLVPLPAGYPAERAAQFANLITAWDLVEASGVQAGQWLALTAGNSTIATLALQLAKRREINVLAIVRRERPAWNLHGLGAKAVIEAATASTPIGDRVSALTGGRGLNAVLDCVGGPLAADLVRCLAVGGRSVIYGGYSTEPFTLHNYDLLLRVATLHSYGYRYFFAPPSPADAPRLAAVAAAFAGSDIALPIGGRHALDDFRTAIAETEQHPELGKRLFQISS